LERLRGGRTAREGGRSEAGAVGEIRRSTREEEPPRPSVRLNSTDTLPSLAACRQTEPARLTELVRGELDWIVMKALDKERNRRYETANGLARDIERYLAGDPVEACPPSASYWLKKFARKNRGALATAGAFAVLLLLATAVSARQAFLATRAAAESRAVQNFFLDKVLAAGMPRMLEELELEGGLDEKVT